MRMFEFILKSQIQKYLWLSIFISFDMGWVSQSINFAVILQLSYSSHTLGFYLSLHICNCQSISVKDRWFIFMSVPLSHQPFQLLFLCTPCVSRLSVHLSPLSVSLSDYATPSFLMLNIFDRSPLMLALSPALKRCNRCESISQH